MCAGYTRESVDAITRLLLDLALIVNDDDARRLAGAPQSALVRPSEVAPVVAVGREGRGRIVFAQWGVVPRFARCVREVGRDGRRVPRPINTRAESLDEGGSRLWAPMRRQRCVVPADRFVEWRAGPGGGRTPKVRCEFGLRSGGPLLMAGLWEVWAPPADAPAGALEGARGGAIASDGRLVTFSVVTCEANDVVRPVHDRMPALLPGDDAALWLDPAAPWEAARQLLRPLDPDAMRLILPG